MINIKAIIKGWDNYIFPNEETEQRAKQRAVTCAKCPFAEKGFFEILMPDYSLKEIEGYKCTQCGCPLSTLLRQNEKTCKKWQK